MNEKAIAIANNINCCVPSTPQQFLVLHQNVFGDLPAGTPVKLDGSQSTNGAVNLPTGQAYFRQAILIGAKLLDGTVNGGNVQIGPSSTASRQPITIGPGETYILAPANGEKWSFSDWYFTCASTDGLVVIYS